MKSSIHKHVVGIGVISAGALDQLCDAVGLMQIFGYYFGLNSG
jgi:hypothetical protein